MTETDLTPDFWQDRYETGTSHWDRGDVHPAIVDWTAQRHLQPCRIVVPGCGRGHEVVFLSRLGFDVTAIDFASAPIDYLKQQITEHQLQATVCQTDALTFQPQARFEAVYEQTCMCALAPRQHVEYESQLYNWLIPGGSLYVLFMQTTNAGGPPFHCGIEEMKQLFHTERWQWPEGDLSRFTHPAGDIFELATILVRR